MSQQQNNQPSSTTPKPKLQAVTPAHLIVSVLITALVTAGNAVLQYVQTNGSHFSVTELLGVGFTALLASLGVGVISLEKNPDIQQAIDGSLAPYVNALNTTLQQHSNIVQQAGQVVSYLIELAQQQAQQKAPVQQQSLPAQPAPVMQFSQAAQAMPAQQTAPVVPAQVAQVPFPPAQGISFADTNFGPVVKSS